MGIIVPVIDKPIYFFVDVFIERIDKFYIQAKKRF